MKQHRLDPVSLICGLVFGGLGAFFLSAHTTPGVRHLHLIFPAAIVLLGLALLASGRRSHAEPVMEPGTPIPEGPTEEQENAD